MEAGSSWTCARVYAPQASQLAQKSSSQCQQVRPVQAAHAGWVDRMDLSHHLSPRELQEVYTWRWFTLAVTPRDFAGFAFDVSQRVFYNRGQAGAATGDLADLDRAKVQYWRTLSPYLCPNLGWGEKTGLRYGSSNLMAPTVGGSCAGVIGSP